MGISDIITLLSLVIAIVAILNEKNRKHILLKFHFVDYILFAVSFLLINYFVFYSGFYSRGIYFPFFYFSSFGLNNPNNYAYLITIIVLLYLFYKVWYAFYPFSKIDSVCKYYEQLIENNEISFLLDLIEKHHKYDIIKLISQSKDTTTNTNWWQRQFKK